MAVNLKGDWRLEQVTDELTDKITPFLINLNTDKLVSISILCSPKTHSPSFIFITPFQNGGGRVNVGDRVSWRFDKEKPIGPIKLDGTAMGGTAILLPPTMKQEFIESLKKSSKLIVRLQSDYNSTSIKDMHYNIKFSKFALDALNCKQAK